VPPELEWLANITPAPASNDVGEFSAFAGNGVDVTRGMSLADNLVEPLDYLIEHLG
jgi:hypothetical protein